MTLEEFQNLQPGDEIVCDGGAIGFVMFGRNDGLITVRWVDTQGRSSNERLRPSRLISMALGEPYAPPADLWYPTELTDGTEVIERTLADREAGFWPDNR